MASLRTHPDKNPDNPRATAEFCRVGRACASPPPPPSPSSPLLPRSRLVRPRVSVSPGTPPLLAPRRPRGTRPRMRVATSVAMRRPGVLRPGGVFCAHAGTRCSPTWMRGASTTAISRWVFLTTMTTTTSRPWVRMRLLRVCATVGAGGELATPGCHPQRGGPPPRLGGFQRGAAIAHAQVSQWTSTPRWGASGPSSLSSRHRRSASPQVRSTGCRLPKRTNP